MYTEFLILAETLFELITTKISPIEWTVWDDVQAILEAASLSACVWVPAVYAAYVIGRRKFSLLSMLFFVTCECFALLYLGNGRY